MIMHGTGLNFNTTPKPFKTANLSFLKFFLINQGSSPNSYHEGIILHKSSHGFL